MYIATRLPSGSIAVTNAQMDRPVLYEAAPESFERWYVTEFGEEARATALEIIDLVLGGHRAELHAGDGRLMPSAPGEQPGVEHVLAANIDFRGALRRGQQPWR